MKFVKRVFLGLLVLVVLVYFGVPLLVSTSWAKERVRSALSEETGRNVAIGSVSFGWFSGLDVRDVRVDQKPGDPADDGPLFELSSLGLDVGVGQVFAKELDIGELSVVDPKIVVIRNADGSLNFSDLLSKPGEEPPPEEKGLPPVTARLTVDGGRILFIDRMENTRVEAGEIDAKALWNGGKLDLDMICVLNGGQLRLRAGGDLASSPPTLSVEELTVDGSEFSTEMAQLAHFMPLLGKNPQQASGTLRFEVRNLRGVGLTADSLAKSLTAKGKISVAAGLVMSEPIREILGGLQPYGVSLDALSAGGKDKGLSMDFFRSSFSIEDGKIHSEDMTLSAAGLEFRLQGWTRLDGKIKYQVQVANLADVVGAKGALGEILKDGILPVDLKGRLSDPKVEFDLEDAARDRLKQEIGDRIGGILGGDEEKKK